MKMPFSMRIPFTFFFQIVSFLVLIFLCLDCQANSSTHQYNFVVKEAPYTRLCSTKKILTVNGKFPGPTLRVRRGDTIFVMVHNKGRHNITIHWHGVAQPRNPWSDGPEYITQCPIQPGGKFNQKIFFSKEEGTVWWHAHSDWSRATVHGAILVYPTRGTSYPFPKPHKEVPIILGEWWKKDVAQVMEGFLMTGGEPNTSDALTINGQPGDLYECSKSGTFKLLVDQKNIYLLRIVNAAMNIVLFFSIAKHNLTVVGSDGSYMKPLTTNYITISPGQTMDALLITNQNHSGHYYMAARAYSSATIVSFDNTTTTAILQYSKRNENDVVSSQMLLPYLPNYNDTESAFDFITKLRSLGDKDHPINVPLNITTKLFSTVSINAFPCQENASCEGLNGTRLAASMNNISFVQPSLVNILDAYYYHINGVFQNDFPRFPPLLFDFTAEYMPLELELPKRATKVKVLDYGSTVEVVFQGTNLVAGIDHPIHLHGYSFYVVGYGFGNFDEERDKLGYNLVDPPLLNAVLVPKNGWTTIRFTADNPGVWFMHCHLERHLSWGMQTVFVVKDGKNLEAKLRPRPSDMPPC